MYTRYVIYWVRIKVNKNVLLTVGLIVVTGKPINNVFKLSKSELLSQGSIITVSY